MALSAAWALAHTELGQALELAGRPAEALAAYRQAYALDATNGIAAARISEMSHLGVPLASEAEDRSPGKAAAARKRAAQLYASGQLEEALALLRSVIETCPTDIDALTAVASIERERGNTEAAAHWLSTALAIEPDNRLLRFRLAVLRGETPADTPPEVIAGIFDAYADRFDEHVVRGFNYRAPEAVVAIMRARSPVPAPDILDLGCGTGLVGAALSQPFGRLVGVDLSSAMLERARARNVYTELHQAELVAHLKSCPDGSFDVVTAADVFVYMGDLRPGFAETARVLRPRGVAVISLEAGTDAGYQSCPRGDLHITATISKVLPAAPVSSCSTCKSGNCAFNRARRCRDISSACADPEPLLRVRLRDSRARACGVTRPDKRHHCARCRTPR